MVQLRRRLAYKTSFGGGSVKYGQRGMHWQARPLHNLLRGCPQLKLRRRRFAGKASPALHAPHLAPPPDLLRCRPQRQQRRRRFAGKAPARGWHRCPPSRRPDVLLLGKRAAPPLCVDRDVLDLRGREGSVGSVWGVWLGVGRCKRMWGWVSGFGATGGCGVGCGAWPL
eukprot:107761-Chlamydomonas_euryale.AAC.6